MTSVDALPVIIIPCYNEEYRLDESGLLQLAESGLVRLLFIDDGSTDDTWAVLTRLGDGSGAINVIRLSQNCGKGEAVRRGFLESSKHAATIIGYYDADLATPPDELLRLVSIMQADERLAAVLGSRVAMLGSKIERTATRHYVGRVYATLASVALGAVIYDTQCGAKVFRVNPTFLEAISRPFSSAWGFDVELLIRLLRGNSSVPRISLDAFREVPLSSWRDVNGSKLRFVDGVSAFLHLFAIGIGRRRFDSNR